MDQSSRPVLILGAGTFAEEVADLAAEIQGLSVAGFVVDSDRERCNEKLHGLPILWVEEVAKFARTHCAVCGINTTDVSPRSRIIEQVETFGLPFISLIHPSARISSTSSFQEGAILGVNSVIAAHTSIGRHVIVNRGALVGHHVKIGDYVIVGPGVAIASSCRIDQGAYMGIGSAVRENISIGHHAVIGAGAAVVKDVPANVVAVGVPAMPIRDHDGPN